MRVINLRGVPDETLISAKKDALDTGVSLKDWMLAAMREKLSRSTLGVVMKDPVQLWPRGSDAPQIIPIETRRSLPKIETVIPPYEPPKEKLTPEQEHDLLVAKDRENKERGSKESDKSFTQVASPESRHSQAFKNRYGRAPTLAEFESFVKKGW